MLGANAGPPVSCKPADAKSSPATSVPPGATARNVRPTRRDEIDIIASRRGTILIVEVKTRQDEAHGRPLDAVNTNKRTHLRKAAAHWLAQNHLQNHPCRFDAIEVIGTPGRPPTLRWVQRLHMPTR